MRCAGRVREVLAQQLVAGTDPEDDCSAGMGPFQCTVGSEGLGRPHLRGVLTTPQAVEIAGRERLVRVGSNELDVDPPPCRPLGQDETVPPIAIGAEQVGVDDNDNQGAVRLAGGRHRSWRRTSAKAV